MHARVLLRDGDSYAFGHAHVREVLYGELEPGRRAQIHVLLGERSHSEVGEQVRRLEAALHFTLAGDVDRAL